MRRDVRLVSVVSTVVGLVVAVGIAVAPMSTLLSVLGIALMWWYYREIRGLLVWQHLLQVCLLGLITLNYGFTNFAVLSVPMAHTLAAVSLLLALFVGGRSLMACSREPAFIALGVLMALTVLHLSVDIQDYGVMALRDASFVVESSLMLAGYGWSLDTARRAQFFRMLAFAFILNFAYTLTYPFKDLLLAYSPTSGLFREVPLLGYYAGTPLFLVAGGFYFMVAGQWLTRWPRWWLLVLAIGQLGWSLVMQDRAMYLGLLFLLAVAIVAGRWTLALKAGALAIVSSVLIFGVIAVFGFEISGRLSNVGAMFFVEHFQSLFMQGETAGVGSNHWRIDILQQVLARWRSHVGTMLIGEGFGQPLTDVRLGAGIDVRQPHNTHLSVLARLGIVGLMVWFWFIATLLACVVTAVRMARMSQPLAQRQLLALLVFLLLGLFYTTVQPWLEFTYGAIPFFVIAGFALGYAGVVMNVVTLDAGEKRPRVKQVKSSDDHAP